ncbi:MarR family transcriptional regulator [Nocardiopsis sp. MG754419]|nr:MarR family transcriptional regulator [Nocardiopsis sp. MG754419]
MMDPDVPDGLFMVVGGRSGTTLRLDPFALVVTERADTAGLSLEQADIVRICDRPIAPAELGARLGIPLGAVTILLADLVDRGHIVLRSAGGRAGRSTPAPASPANDRQLLEKLRVGLINLPL